MARTAREVPPPLELLCLKAIWAQGESRVKTVHEVIVQSRPLAYTTILTTMDRLARKGILKRRKLGKAFLYEAKASREELRRAAVRELLDGYFDGSEGDLIRFLRGLEPASAAPLQQERIDTVLL